MALFMLSTAAIDNKEDDKHLFLQAALASVLFLGINDAHFMKIYCHNPNQLYLCCHDLLPNPRLGTPWQII
jgi:hypothetical protein